jgi:hypothetical protein
MGLGVTSVAGYWCVRDRGTQRIKGECVQEIAGITRWIERRGTATLNPADEGALGAGRHHAEFVSAEAVLL